MNELNRLFRNRIGIAEYVEVNFYTLSTILEKTAETIPFENLCIMANHNTEISRSHLIDKILLRKEGGLCYELNTILYYFLKENGLNVRLVRGATYNSEKQSYSLTGKTHVVILLEYNRQEYVVDTGYGSNLPLRLVPLTGEAVFSNNGEFRITPAQTEFGDYILEMKLKHKDHDWKIGYAFDSKRTISNNDELNDIQKIIVESAHSPFNKGSLVTKNTSEGNITLTDTSFTQCRNGEVKKEELKDRTHFQELLKKHFI